MPTPKLDLHQLGTEFTTTGPNSQFPHRFNSETIWALETAGQLKLQSVNAFTPPGSPAVGEAYHVRNGDSASAWNGVRNKIMVWTGGSWVAVGMYAGMRAYVVEDAEVRYATPVGTSQDPDYTWLSANVILSQTWQIPNPNSIASNPQEIPGTAHYALFKPPVQGIEIYNIRAKLHGPGALNATVSFWYYFPSTITFSNNSYWYFSDQPFLSTIIGNELILSTGTATDTQFQVPTNFDPVSTGWVACRVSKADLGIERLDVNILTSSSF